MECDAVGDMSMEWLLEMSGINKWRADNMAPQRLVGT
jgi:hypothetical protein